MTSRATNSGSSGDMQETAVPTLRVMRLQNPEIHTAAAGCLDCCNSILNNALCLPDSLDVYVGEVFTAYLGVINSSKHTSIRRLTVTAQLQTPTQRWQLRSPLDGGGQGYGMDVPPLAGVDAVVSHLIEEAGQHILRAEVTSLAADGNLKTFRKFYRCQVSYPIEIHEYTVRDGDTGCWVTLSIEYTNNAEYANSKDVLVIAGVDFQAADGLTANCLGAPCARKTTIEKRKTTVDAIELYDAAHVLQRGTSVRYLFHIQASSEKSKMSGLAGRDLLGRAVVTWCKSMGEQGRVCSRPIVCPMASPEGLICRTGLSMDVATSNKLSCEFPVTVEPIDPPRQMPWQIPTKVQFLVVNHSKTEKALKLHFQSTENGLSVYGRCGLSLGTIPGNGGSKVTSVHFVALTGGLLRLDGCVVIDLATDTAILQPPLFDVMVDIKHIR